MKYSRFPKRTSHVIFLRNSLNGYEQAYILDRKTGRASYFCNHHRTNNFYYMYCDKFPKRSFMHNEHKTIQVYSRTPVTIIDEEEAGYDYKSYFQDTSAWT